MPPGTDPEPVPGTAARARLEAQVKLVHDVTGRTLNDIRADLALTRDPHRTITRILGGEFLKGTARDPGASRRRESPGKSGAAVQVIDLCDSDDEPPPAPAPAPAPNPRTVQPQTWRRSPPVDGGETEWAGGAFEWRERRRSPVPAGPLHVPAEHRPDAALANNAVRTPVRPRPQPRHRTPERPVRQAHPEVRTAPVRHHVPSPPPMFASSLSPLLRYRALSPPLASPERPEPRGVTLVDFRVGPPATPPPPPPPPPVSKTPVGKRQEADVIAIGSDSDGHAPPPQPPPPPISAPTTAPRRRTRRKLSASPAGEPALSNTTRSLLHEFENEARSGGDSEDDDDDGEPPASTKKRKKRTPAKKNARPKATPAKRKPKPAAPDAAEEEQEEESDDTLSCSPTKSTRARATPAEKALRAAAAAAAREAAKLQRQQERAEKAAARDAAKAQKQREREARDAAKKQEQELALANKLRVSRRDSAAEMIVDVSQHLKESATGQSLARFLAGLGCEVNQAWYPPVPEGGGQWCVVKWRRKVKAEWDEARGLFVPLPAMRVADERHVLIYLAAHEFRDIAVGLALAGHVARARAFAPCPQQAKVMYLLEGMEALLRRNRANRNREYQNRVRAALGEGGAVPADAELLDEDVVQDALLALQAVHGCLVHHTASGVESAEWISRFTADMSTIPYKNSRATAAAGFCTDVGQVRVGIGSADIFRRMLEEVHRVTPGVAAAVAGVYGDVRALVRAFEERGEDVLADIPLVAARGGGERTVGVALSRRVAGVFMERDPESVEV